MNPYAVLLKPVVSEKSDTLRERFNKYTFLVHAEASKHDVKAAVEQLFAVKVVKVHTCLTRGKWRRRGMHVSRTSKKKKAVVTLLPEQKLDIFAQ